MNCGQRIEYGTDKSGKNSTAQSDAHNVSPVTQEAPARYLSAWKYVGYKILFAIPLVGFICALVSSFSEDINLRNYARSYFCYALIIIGVIMLLYYLGISDDVINQILGLIGESL